MNLDWHARAACRDHPDPDMWFPGPGVSRRAQRAVEIGLPRTKEHAMTDTLRDRIAAVQQAHIFRITKCSCGYMFPWEKSTEWRERAEWEWARHVADAILAIPGIAVVELPEPDEGRDDAWYDSAVHLGQPNYVAMPRTVFVEPEPGEPIPLSPGVARLVAAALLAAADYAERDQ